MIYNRHTGHILRLSVILATREEQVMRMRETPDDWAELVPENTLKLLPTLLRPHCAGLLPGDHITFRLKATHDTLHRGEVRRILRGGMLQVCADETYHTVHPRRATHIMFPPHRKAKPRAFEPGKVRCISTSEMKEFVESLKGKPVDHLVVDSVYAPQTAMEKHASTALRPHQGIHQRVHASE